MLRRVLLLLGVALLLTVYSRWLMHVRPARPAGAGPPTTRSAGDGLPLLRLSEARELWGQEGTLFVDVRSRSDYEFGHIRGAVSLPEEEIASLLPRLQSRLERARVIIVYCKSPDCGKSLWAALRLRNAGLTQTWIFPGGWNDWDYHDLPRARRP